MASPRAQSVRPSPGASGSLATRFLALAGDADPRAASVRIGDFRRFLLVYGAARSWLWVAFSPSDRGLLVVLAGVLTAAAALAFGRERAPTAARVALPAVLLQAAWGFPLTANHLYLEGVCVALLALVRRDDPEDASLALAGLRWVTVVVLFHTGLQKVLYGHYFHGDFLALMAGAQERFGRIFRWLIPAGELERLQALDRRQTGAGPFRVDHPALVLASNVVWLAEMSLPVLMMARRSRVWGALGGLALMVGIQVAALEIGFALLFVNLLLLFLPGRPNAWLLPATLGVLLWALGAAAGLLPGDPSSWNLL